MKKTKDIRILIINPNSSEEMTNDIQRAAESYADGEFTVRTVSTPGAPEFIDYYIDAALAAPGMMQIIRDKLNSSIISEGNFKVGVIRNATNIGDKGNLVHAGIPINQFTKHALIVGMPGSGKTNFSLGILLQFWKGFGLPFLAIEPTKTEYRALIDVIPDLQVFSPGKN